jgi:REP element-mobilizing transposase RayT
MRTLDLTNRERLLNYICGIIKQKKSFVYQINMVEDHIHILCSIHCQENVSDLVKYIKNSTNILIKNEHIFPMFDGWQKGYGAFTVNWREKQGLIDYIKNQQEHHKLHDFMAEYKKMLDEFGISYEDKYL